MQELITIAAKTMAAKSKGGMSTLRNTKFRRFEEPRFPFDKFFISNEELKYRFKTRHPKTDQILTKAIEGINYG